MQTKNLRQIWQSAIDHRWQVASAVVLGWSIAETLNLARVHTTGAEMYGVMTAAVATGAAIANLALLRSPQARLVLTAAVLLVWGIVALGGLAGTIAHIVGPVAGHGPVDLGRADRGAPRVHAARLRRRSGPRPRSAGARAPAKPEKG